MCLCTCLCKRRENPYLFILNFIFNDPPMILEYEDDILNFFSKFFLANETVINREDEREDHGVAEKERD